MSQSRPRRSRDPNKRAFEVCQEATGGPPPTQETVEETLESMSAAMHGDASMRSRAVQVLTGIIKSEHDAARKIDKNLEWRIRRRDEHQKNAELATRLLGGILRAPAIRTSGPKAVDVILELMTARSAPCSIGDIRDALSRQCPHIKSTGSLLYLVRTGKVERVGIGHYQLVRPESATLRGSPREAEAVGT